MRDRDEILKHYLICAMWANGEDQIGDLDEFTPQDVDPTSKEDSENVIKEFLRQASPLLTEDWSDEQIGHDLWLTRAGHGTGFWDRALPNGDELADICKTIEFNGEVYEEEGVVFIHELMTKVFNTQYNIGTVKYVVNFHNGVSKHKDGSTFFDIGIFKNKKKFEKFMKDLRGKGYTQTN